MRLALATGSTLPADDLALDERGVRSSFGVCSAVEERLELARDGDAAAALRRKMREVLAKDLQPDGSVLFVRHQPADVGEGLARHVDLDAAPLLEERPLIRGGQHREREGDARAREDAGDLARVHRHAAHAAGRQARDAVRREDLEEARAVHADVARCHQDGPGERTVAPPLDDRRVRDVELLGEGLRAGVAKLRVPREALAEADELVRTHPHVTTMVVVLYNCYDHSRILVWSD